MITKYWDWCRKFEKYFTFNYIYCTDCNQSTIIKNIEDSILFDFYPVQNCVTKVVWRATKRKRKRQQKIRKKEDEKKPFSNFGNSSNNEQYPVRISESIHYIEQIHA